MTSPSSRRAHVVGLGLIGGSVALALNERGWLVSGRDRDELVTQRAIERGIVGTADPVDGTELVVIATPAGVVAAVANEVLNAMSDPALVVTDVSGIKGAITNDISDPRFIGGHPMAGSEQRGLDGARADLFNGCTWVLTPRATTPAESYGRLHGWLRELDANVIALDAATHDRLVATASHVPHLVAGALMNEAAELAESDAALLQLAAGGFRDMTRVSAGDPAIWPDVLNENKEAVTTALASLRERLQRLEDKIARSDREGLMEDLRRAAISRRELPGRAVPSATLTHLRVPVPDRPGVLAQVTTTASEVGVNIFDIEIAHSVEGRQGVILLAVEIARADRLARALEAHGYRVSREGE